MTQHPSDERAAHADSSPITPIAAAAPVEAADEYYLARAPMRTALAHLAVPMMAAMAVNTVYAVINSWFLGQQGDLTLLAAITFGLPILPLIMAAGGVFGVGGGTMISRLLGAGGEERRRVKAVSAFTVWGALAAGVLILVVCIALLDPITHLLGADEASFEPTRTYIFWAFCSAPILTMSFAIEQIVRAVGAAKQSMIGLILSTVANFVFDAILIPGLGWGVAGAAIAVGLSNIVTVAYLLRVLAKRAPEAMPELGALTTLWRSGRFGATAREVFAVGSSELIQSGFLIVSALVMNLVAITYGNAVVAGFGTAARITQVSEFLAMGLTMGALPLIAYTFGRGDRARLSQAMRAVTISIIALVGPLSLLTWIFRDTVMGWFTSDPEMLEVGGHILTAMLVTTVFNGLVSLFIAYFQGTGAARFAAVAAMSQGVLFFPAILGMNALWHLDGMIWANPIAEMITFAVCLGMFVVHARRGAGAVDGAGAGVADGAMDAGRSAAGAGRASAEAEGAAAGSSRETAAVASSLA